MQAPAGGAGQGRGGVRGRVGAHGRRAARRSRTAPAGALDGVRPAAVRALGRGRAAAGAGLLRREPRVRPEHPAGVRPLLPGIGPRGRRGRGALPLALPAGRGEGPRRALGPWRDRGARGGAARRVPAAALDRPPPGLHRRERDAEGGPRARRGRPRPRRAPALPAGGAALRAAAAGRAGSTAARVAERFASSRERLSAADVDHSLGRLFLERAQEALAASPPGPAATAGRSPPTCCPATSRPSSPAAPSRPGRSRGSRSRSCAGPTPETSPTRQVCWHRASCGSRRPASSSRTTATRRSRSASASRATR